MSESHPNAPFKTLGTHLKYLRQQANQTLAEVCGAVEIDLSILERIENGEERPAEDILLLLISHFEMRDQEAVQLWELAGYDGEVPEKIRPTTDDLTSGKSVVMLLALDMRTMYSDGLDINCNQAGLTLNFTQAAGQTPATPIARIGMSYEQAERVVHSLQQALLQAKYLRGPKALPPKSDSQSDNKPA